MKHIHNMVYYRKYRPQTLEDLDSTSVRETLLAVFASNNIPHAFLFTGQKGLGKTSTARIVAKIVNCTNKKKGSIEPCNSCESCVSITAGSSMDILEVDGASNRGIDEIRDLRDKVKLAPSNAKKKVYIIDEVHMLTTEAFNALLKTIEEPPSHAMFIFCTTESQKVPATILSRCFHVAFPKATNEDIVHSLERIVTGEKLKIATTALHEIAALADGGFRDGAKILEELVAIAGEKEITKEFINAHYKTTNILLHVESFLRHLAMGNVKESLQVISLVEEQGTDMKYFISQALSKLHVLLLSKLGIQANPSNINLELDDIKRLVELFSQAYQQTKHAVIAQLPLELAVVTWFSSEPLRDEENEAQPTNQLIVAKKAITIDTLRKQERTLKVRSIIDGKKEEKIVKEVDSSTQGELHHDTDAIAVLMENLIYKVKPFNHSLAGILRGCSIASYDQSKLVLETAYKFHKERLDDMKSKEILEKVIKEVTGKQTQIMVQLKG